MFLSNVLLAVLVHYEKRCRNYVKVKIYQERSGACRYG